MKKKILFVLLLGLILYPANKVTNYNISSVNYKEGNEVDNQIEVEWQKKWGGNAYDKFNSIIETQDGYIAVGGTNSDDIEGVSEGFAVIVKFDKSGNVIWQKSWECESNDSSNFYSVIEVEDGFIAAGVTSPPHIYNGRYAVIVKFDKDGNVIWQKDYKVDNDVFRSIIEVEDGFVVVGDTGNIERYNDGQTINGQTTISGAGALIIKYDKSGNLIWKKGWGGRSADSFNSIIESDDGYIMIGKSYSDDIIGLDNNGGYDAIIIKIDKNGNLVWQKNYGGDAYDEFNSIIETQDGYIVIGESCTSDITGLTNNEYSNAIMVKYDKNGNVIWQKNYGGNGNDRFYSIIEMADGYLVLGDSNSTDIEGLSTNGYTNALSVKYDKNGNIIWQKSWEGITNFYSAIKISDGYISIGEYNMVTGNQDALIVKFKSVNNVEYFNDNELLNSNSKNTTNNANIDTDIEDTKSQETVVDAPNTLSFISKTLLIISGLLIVFGIGLYGYNLYKLKKNSK